MFSLIRVVPENASERTMGSSCCNSRCPYSRGSWYSCSANIHSSGYFPIFCHRLFGSGKDNTLFLLNSLYSRYGTFLVYFTINFVPINSRMPYGRLHPCHAIISSNPYLVLP
jgi:hypothetical protein